jgi:Winged helix DNA-binding domain
MPVNILLNISGVRMVSQQFCGTSIKTGSDMVSWFGAVQGQEYTLTKWALGLRLPHLKEDDIEKEFNAGKLLRTHLMRSTWHIVHADDIRWILQLTAPRVEAINAFMYKTLELDSAQFRKSNKVIAGLLKERHHQTRKEINEFLKRNRIIAEGHRLAYILMKAEIEGIICSGPRHGNQFTYALLDERTPGARTKDRDAALADFTRKYFRGRGPATVHDFATWSGLTMGDCRNGVDYILPELEKYNLENKEYYFINRKPPDVVLPEKPFLLPIYDEFIMGYKNRAAMLEFIENSGNGRDILFNNMILHKGQVIGTWRRIAVKKHLSFETDLFISLNPELKENLQKEIVRFGEFFGLTTVFSLPQ